MEQVLTAAEINRATLARQLLLQRSDLTPLDAVRHLMGLQSQAPQPPYVGLWTRLNDFDPHQLSDLLEQRKVVRIALMRSTVHLVETAAAHRMREALETMLERGLQAPVRKLLAGTDRPALTAAIRELMAAGPHTFAGVAAALADRWPDLTTDALGHAARTWLPLVQVPPRGLWQQTGPAAHLPLDDWAPAQSLVSARTPLQELVLGYLGAFGPATIADAQKWSGLTRLNLVFTELAGELVTFRSATGALLYDLPDAPRPPGDTRAPVRFLPEWDNLLLSHVDRSRVISEPDRLRVFTINGIIRSTILVDGTVAGIWKIDGGALLIEPFRPLTQKTRSALTSEGRRLLTFLEAPGDVSFGT